MSHFVCVHSAMATQAEPPWPPLAVSTLHTSHVQEHTAEGHRVDQGQQQVQAAPQQTGAAESQPAASTVVPALVANDMTAKARLYTQTAMELH